MEQRLQYRANKYPREGRGDAMKSPFSQRCSECGEQKALSQTAPRMIHVNTFLSGGRLLSDIFMTSGRPQRLENLPPPPPPETSVNLGLPLLSPVEGDMILPVLWLTSRRSDFWERMLTDLDKMYITGDLENSNRRNTRIKTLIS